MALRRWRRAVLLGYDSERDQLSQFSRGDLLLFALRNLVLTR